MKIYNYNPETSFFTVVTSADISPLDNTEFLIPAYATTTPINEDKALHKQKFDPQNNTWVYVLDESTRPSPLYDFDKDTNTWVVNADRQAEYNANKEASDWKKYQLQAQALLSKSDLTAMRCFKAGLPYPKEWIDFDSQLREIVRTESGDSTQALPVQPAYPVGT